VQKLKRRNGKNKVLESDFHREWRELAEDIIKYQKSMQTKRQKGKVTNQNQTRNRFAAQKGKFKVIGVDKFDGDEFQCGIFKTAREAIEYARMKTIEAMKYASDSSIATLYYAYDDQGRYLGSR